MSGRAPGRFVLGLESTELRNDGSRLTVLDKDDYDFLKGRLGGYGMVEVRLYDLKGNFVEQGWFNRGDSEQLGEDAFEIIVRFAPVADEPRGGASVDEDPYRGIGGRDFTWAGRDEQDAG